MIRVPTDVIFRSAVETDLSAIVALLADDMIGAGREGGPDHDAYLTGFQAVTADPRNDHAYTFVDYERRARPRTRA